MPYRPFDDEDYRRWSAIYGQIDALDRRYKVNKRVGWVYVMRNPSFKDELLKIGRTSRSPLERMAELGSSTSVPAEFELIYFVHVSDSHAAERLVHHWLAEHRKSRKKEFFGVPLVSAIEALDAVANQYPIHVWHQNQSGYLPQYFEPVIVDCSDCGTRNTAKLLMIETRILCRTCGKPLTI